MNYKPLLKISLKIVGCLLIFGSIFVAYWWFYKLIPIKHLTDEQWLQRHTEKARWNEEQKKYSRLGLSPDLCNSGDRIGYYGNKKWFEWLVGKIQNPHDFRLCGCTETALMFMTNHYEKSWINWLNANRHKTQEKWIQSGFAKIAVKVHLPPTPADIKPLLRLLGQESWNVLWRGPKNKDNKEAVPSYIKYNAFRWLRDSGFDPLKYSLEHTAIPEDIKSGLLHYDDWNKMFPKKNAVGILFIAENSSPPEEPFLIEPPPLILEARFTAVVYMLIILPFIGGLLLILVPRKNKKNGGNK